MTMVSKWLQRICIVAALAGVAVGVLNLFHFLHYAWMAERFPYGQNYVEGILWSQSEEFARGQSIYSPFDQPPYTVGNYPPLYPLLCSLSVPLGISALAFGRVVSAISILLCAVLVALCVFDASAERSAEPNGPKESTPLTLPRFFCGALAGLCFLQIPYVYAWGPLMRVDMLAWTFSLLGLYVLMRAQGRRRYECAAILLFVLAAYTKHSVVACALAGLAAVAVRDRMRGLRLFAAYAGAGIAVFLILNLVTGGWFWKHLLLANAMPFSWPQAWKFVSQMLSLNALWSILAVLYVVWEWARPRASAAFADYRVALPVFLVLAALVGLGSGKIGADRNYLVEFSLAACVCAGAMLARMWSNALHAGTRWPMGVLATLVLVTLHMGWTYLRLLPSDPGKFLDAKTAQELDRLQSVVNAMPGEVYSEEATFLLNSGRRVEFQAFDMVMLAKAGYWDQTPVRQKFERQAYALIILQQDVNSAAVTDRLTAEMAAAIRVRYRCVFSNGYYWFYRPVMAEESSAN